MTLNASMLVALAQAAPQLPVVTAASKWVPGVTWRPKSVVAADFTCRGRREQAILGATAQEIVVAVFINGLNATPEVLRYSAAMRDARSIELATEGVD